jgi:hypothetical protein
MIFYFFVIFLLLIIGVVERDTGMFVASALFSIALEISVLNERGKKK